MKPDLKLKIKKEMDIANAQDRLWHSARYSPASWFFPKDFQYILSKRFSIKERDKIIIEQALYFYRVNKKEIEKGLAEVSREWKRVEKRYYRIIDQIFHGYRWPKGKYAGYVSIYNMYPRNLKYKYFFFPYSGGRISPTKVIAHEMLHFIFFDYLKHRYGIDQSTKFAGKDPKYVWQVSEVFNDTIENWAPYKKIFNLEKESKPYPGCEKIFVTMKRQWKSSQDLDVLLDKWFLLKKAK
jgi:hypothetical protein